MQIYKQKNSKGTQNALTVYKQDINSVSLKNYNSN